MSSAFDNFVRGAVVYIVAILRAIAIGSFGILTFRGFRSAMRLRMLAVSDPDFTVSGRAMILLACMTITVLLRDGFSKHLRDNIFKIVSDTGELTKMFIASLVTSLTLEILIILLIGGAQNRRFGRHEFSRRKAIQRAEILRYMVASYLMFVCIALMVLFLPRWNLDWIGPWGWAPPALILISFVLAVGGAYGGLIQTQMPLARGKRLVARAAAGILASAVLILPLVFAIALQSNVVAAIFPSFWQQGGVKQIAARCAISEAGDVSFSVTYRNPTDDWRYLDPSEVILRFNNSETDMFAKGTIHFHAVALAGKGASMMVLAPKTSETFDFAIPTWGQNLVFELAASSRNAAKPVFCRVANMNWQDEDDLAHDSWVISTLRDETPAGR